MLKKSSIWRFTPLDDDVLKRTYHWAVSILISYVSNGHHLSLGRGPGEPALDGLCDLVASDGARVPALLGRDSVVGLVAAETDS